MSIRDLWLLALFRSAGDHEAYARHATIAERATEVSEAEEIVAEHCRNKCTREQFVGTSSGGGGGQRRFTESPSYRLERACPPLQSEGGLTVRAAHH